MKSKIILYIVLTFMGLIALSWGLEYLNIVRFGIFEPMKENARREVFEETQSYVEGKRQEIEKLRLEYMRAKNETEKEVIRSVVIQNFANIETDKFTGESYKFLTAMKENRNYQLGVY